MRFTLKNLGRLREATIDLSKDLILLTGPNNTSKTYVAYAIYGFAKSVERILSEIFTERLQPQLSADRIEFDLTDILGDDLPLFLRSVTESYTGSLSGVFGSDEAFTANASVEFDLGAVNLEALRSAILATPLHLESDSSVLGFRLIGDKQPGSRFFVLAQTPPATNGGASASNSSEATSYLRIAAASILTIFFSQILFPQLGLPLIFTAERSAIQLFSRELLGRRAGADGYVGALKAFTQPRQRTDRYPMPIRDGLSAASEYYHLKRLTSPLAPLVDKLEQDLMQGSVRVGEDGDMSFQPEGAQAGMDMHLASSSVKSLSGMSFYLRHLAQEGQLLVIDEPELNLHPDNQRRVARLLARIARAGVKVLISTHSDYVIREINNLIMLSADQDGALLQKHGYERDETLTPEQVGAYLFDRVSARPIPVEPTGIEVKTIDEEINKLNAASQDIYFSLFEDKDR